MTKINNLLNKFLMNNKEKKIRYPHKARNSRGNQDQNMMI